MKKRIIAALGVALVLAIAALTATAVLADSDDALQNMLDAMVESGKLTQAEADAKLDWTATDKAFAPKKEIADLEGYLAKLVAAGVLTKAEADAKLGR